MHSLHVFVLLDYSTFATNLRQHRLAAIALVYHSSAKVVIMRNPEKATYENMGEGLCLAKSTHYTQ